MSNEPGKGVLITHSFGEKKVRNENSLEAQWLGLHAFTSVGLDWIPGRETKIPQAAPRRPKEKEKRK